MVSKKKNEPTPQYRAMMELRRSSAASKHQDARTKKARSKKNAMRKELKTYE